MFISKYGLPHLRLRAANFESLVQMICSQQVSTVAASTIFKRIQKLEKQLSPEFISGLSLETLRDTGLSYSKVGYIKGLAGEIISGKFNLTSFDNGISIQFIEDFYSFYMFLCISILYIYIYYLYKTYI